MSELPFDSFLPAATAPEVREFIADAVTAAPTPPTESELKKRFALELLRTPNAPFAAAQRVFSGNASEAIYKCVSWPNDPEVLAFIAQLTATVPKSNLLPTKEDLGRSVYELVSDFEKKMDVKERLYGFRLFGEIMGYIEKPGAVGASVVVNNAVVNKVMVVKDHGTDDDWETKAQEQQRKLVAEARNKTIDA